MSRIAFLGIGRMGAGMAARLVATGHRVTVYNRTAARAETLLQTGATLAYKLVINLIGSVQIASAAEGLALAERAGLDPAVVAEAMASSQAASPQVVRNTQRMLAGDFNRDVTFTAALRLKDVDYALRLADTVGVGTPFGAAARAALRRLLELGGGEQHEGRIIEVARGCSNVASSSKKGHP